MSVTTARYPWAVPKIPVGPDTGQRPRACERKLA